MDKIKLGRLESLAQRELSLWLLGQSRDEALKRISVMEVRITNDLSFMTIFYTVFKEENIKKYEELLEKYKVEIRKHLASKIKARKMPELVFKYDESLAYGNHIDELINSLKK